MAKDNYVFGLWQPLPNQLNEEYLERRLTNSGRDNHSLCESRAEEELLHGLEKVYPVASVHAQYRVGRYRLDFATNDGVGWEIDGKPYHDKKYDDERDAWILANSEIRQIVRIEAAAFRYYRDACLAALSFLVPQMKEAENFVDSIFRPYCKKPTLGWMP